MLKKIQTHITTDLLQGKQYASHEEIISTLTNLQRSCQQ